MKRSLLQLVLGGLFITLLILALLDWPHWFRSISELLLAALCLFTLLGVHSDQASERSQKILADERDEFLTYKTDHDVVTIMEPTCLLLFLIFMLLYHLQNNNLYVGLIAICCLIFWLMLILLGKIFGLIENKSN
ncbi:hypothetical protein [Levilactobacillus bambusae]|uniref:DUF2178 domain-containing protein n=1 Tax=Levilactobacillus bambusae TaxID=2024736 RepID=A0A2V1MZL2_9LACO|nr:hypothetical protein [Levilactobacillus bambusae]PWG00419.1 hypothetical protein DCM90_05700 [Levilactobacillus bambusae]